MHYVSVLNGTETIDLEAGILPLVGGVASNIEVVDVVMPIALQNPGNQTGKAGVAIAPLQIVTTGGVGTKTFSATGLPTGLSIDFRHRRDLGDDLRRRSIRARISTSMCRSVTTPAPRALPLPGPCNWPGALPAPAIRPCSKACRSRLQIPFNNPDNLPISFSQSGLPAYLHVDSQTGLISGTIYFYHQSYGQDFTFPVTIRAYDGVHQQQVSFNLMSPGLASMWPWRIARTMPAP